MATSIRSGLRPHIVRLMNSGANLAYRHNWLEARPDTEPPADPTSFPGLGEMLHHLRSVEMSRMPRTEGALLSAGAAGTWYFEWVEKWYGPTGRHIGIELYEAEPENLPEYVEWIKNSVSDMAGVDDASIGLIFSGQNFEHLFHDDATAFLRECHRVLEVGGHLVIDSPNRTVTGPLVWSHHEHTIEFTPAEAAELVTLAGFDVTSVRGLWLCREPGTGELLPLWGSPGVAELTRRALLAVDRPDDAFIWWLEASKADREPDVEGLRRRHGEIFAVAWPERQQRLQSQVGEQQTIGDDVVVTVPVGTAGAAMFGPSMPLAPGHYRATVELRRRGSDEVEGELASADVFTMDGVVWLRKALTAADLPPDVWTRVDLDFDVSEIAWGGQFRVWSTGAVPIEVKLHVDLDETGTNVAPSHVPA